MTRGARQLPLVGTAAVLALLVGAPFLFIVLQAVFPDIAEGSLARPFGAAAAFAEPDLPRLACNTLLLGAAVAFGTAAVGVPLGVARGLIRIPGARVLDAALFASFVIPPYLSTLGWILLLQPRGWLERAIGVNFGSLLFSFGGLVLVMTLHLFPVVYFATFRAVAAAGDRLVAVARLFGASPARAFARILLPLTAPAVASALLLTFSATIDEFGTPAALGSESHFGVLVTAIDQRVSDSPVDLPGAAALSLVLSCFGLIAFAIQNRLLRRLSVETLVGKPRDIAARTAVFAPLLTSVFALVALTAAGAPLLSIAAAAFARTLSGGLRPGNFGLTHFQAIFSDADGAFSALVASLSLATATALATAFIGTAAALVCRKGDGFASRFVVISTVLPNATPAIVVAVGLILFWNQRFLPLSFYGSWPMLAIAYTCLLLPYPTRYASSSLRQIGRNLEPAARVAGARPLVALARVTLPLLAPSLIAAMMLVFAVASRELVASTLLAPTGGATIATYIWRQFEQGSLGDGMAMSLLAILVTTAALGVASWAGSSGANRSRRPAARPRVNA